MSFGLVGARLGHSCSPRIHALLGNPDYRLIELDEPAMRDFFAARDFDGVNVTIPYKRAVLPLLDCIDRRAARIGAVNTVVRGADGRLTGYNTDFDGFSALCAYADVPLRGRRVLILGSGGTAQTVRAVAEEAGAADIRTVSRSGELNYETMYELRETEVLVNTTPVGMFPDNDGCPADPSRFPALRGVLDVVFNPQTTELVRRARAAGLPASGGLPMLVMQAVRAHELFFGRPVEPQTAARVLETILGERRSYVFIGMPGCGKTTVGKLLAALCGRRFCDLDAEIARRSGLSAAEWIQTRGEAAFRAYESEVCAALAAESGLVIACGGGTVTREENMRRLARNGVLVYLTRPLEALATEERPLSAGGVAVLYEARRPLYEAYADVTVANDGDPAETARAVLARVQNRKEAP